MSLFTPPGPLIQSDTNNTSVKVFQNAVFTNNCIVPTPTESMQAANKAYVDSVIPQLTFGGISDSWSGGGTFHTFAAVGIIPSCIVVGNIRSSDNAVAIAQIIPGTDTLDIVFTADPGTGTIINWIAMFGPI